MNDAALDPRERWALTGAVAIGLALLVDGALRHDLWAQLELVPAAQFLGVFAGVFVVSEILARLLRARPVAVAAVLVVSVYAVALGFASTAAVALLAACALALGSLLVDRDAPAAPWIALVAGLGLISGVVGWLLPLRVHFGPVYALAAIAIVASRRAAVLDFARVAVASWRRGDGAPHVGALAIAAAAAIATTTWLPTTQFDDLAYHLGMPYQLAEYGRYRMDPASNVWALAAWSGDVLQSVAQLVAGREARGAVNALYIAALLHLVHALGRKAGLSPRATWLAVMLVASQPIIATLGFAMQTELAAALAVAAAALVAQSTTRARAERDATAAAVMLGFALGLKVSNAFFVLPLGVWLLVRWRGIPWRAFAPAVALAVLVGGSSYFFATVIAGNPVLPLYNDVFGSPYFPPQRFVDPRYQGQLSWTAIYDVVVDTSRYYESWDGVGGFQWLVLAGPLLFALRDGRLRALALVGGVAAAAFFAQVQYLRYLFPALALLSVPLVGGLGRAAGSRLVAAVCLALATANVAFAANTAWALRYGFLGNGLGTFEREREWLSWAAPERLAARFLSERYADRYRVFFPQPGFTPTAELAGRGFGTSWYDQWLFLVGLRAFDDSEGLALAHLAEELGASHVMIDTRQDGVSVRAMVDRYGAPEFVAAHVALYRVRRTPLRSDPPPVPVGVGYDYQFPLPVERRATLADARLEARCSPAGAGVLVRWHYYRDAEGQRAQDDYMRCDPTGRIVLRAAVDVRRPVDRLELRIEPVPGTRLSDLEVDVEARRDLTTERDLRYRLRD